MKAAMLDHYRALALRSFGDYGRYLWHDITHPSWRIYFYGLIVMSVVVYGLELAFPWRKDQPRVRKDFWLDGFYMFFNLFLFWSFHKVHHSVEQMGFAAQLRFHWMETVVYRAVLFPFTRRSRRAP